MAKDISRSVGHHLSLAARLHRMRAAQLLATLGLFPGQERVLQILMERGTLTMGELAEALRVRPPTASKTVARLSAQGVLQRQASDGDGRIVRVGLTERGLEQARMIDELWQSLDEELLAGFDGKERKRLRKLLRKASGNLGRLSGAVGEEVAEIDELEDADDL